MLVWLLVLSAYQGGLATVIVADQESCERAGKRFVASAPYAAYSCTQVRVPVR